MSDTAETPDPNGYAIYTHDGIYGGILLDSDGLPFTTRATAQVAVDEASREPNVTAYVLPVVPFVADTGPKGRHHAGADTTT